MEVLVVDNSQLDDLPFPESEPLGQNYLQGIFPNTQWLQTSYNNNFRKRFAGVGFVYMSNYDVFAQPCGNDYFVFDTEIMAWIPPEPYPEDGKIYGWDDASRSWVIVSVPFTTIG